MADQVDVIYMVHTPAMPPPCPKSWPEWELPLAHISWEGSKLTTKVLHVAHCTFKDPRRWVQPPPEAPLPEPPYLSSIIPLAQGG